MAPSPDESRVLEAVRAAVTARAGAAPGFRPDTPAFPWTGVSEWWVAFSGGIDSSVLLDSMACVLDGDRGGDANRDPGRPRIVRTRLAAIHVNHGLHPDAGAWEEHCRRVARSLGIRFEVRRVVVRPGGGRGGIESAARAARLAALRETVPPGAPVLFAHHRDDQAETVLLRILRGAGPAGIAAMREEATVGGLRMVRPFLALSRAQLLAYATARGLAWIEDPGNRAEMHDRNFVRHRVLPVLAERWPDAAATLPALAAGARETASLLDDLAAADLASAPGRAPGTLSATAISALPLPRAANALRAWLVSRHGPPPPPRRWLRTLVEEVAGASRDRLPEAIRGGIWVRRFRDDLHSGTVRLDLRLPARTPWRPDRGPLVLPHGRLGALRDEGRGGLAIARLPISVEVRFRRGGERCRPSGRGLTKPLKDLFQEQGVPPWERGARPLVFAGNRLAAAPGLFVCDPFAARGEEPAWRLQWTPQGRG